MKTTTCQRETVPSLPSFNSAEAENNINDFLPLVETVACKISDIDPEEGSLNGPKKRRRAISPVVQVSRPHLEEDDLCDTRAEAQATAD